jgi:precorrin-3B synthase
VLRPTETGDGLIAKVRAPGGRLTLDQAATLAVAARACGNGRLLLSARANFHIRGVSEATLADLHRRLGGVGLLDRDPDVERLRNIVASPLSDLDQDAAFDLAPSVAALERRLAEDRSLRPLPEKFGYVIDSRGRLPLADIDADIRFEGTFEADEQAFAVYLSGEDAWAVVSASDEIGQAAARLAHAFLALAGAGEDAPRRMRTLVARVGAEAVFNEAGFDAVPYPRASSPVRLAEALGAHAYRKTIVVGAAAPFGEIDSNALSALIGQAHRAGADGLRLAPWRTLFFTGAAPRGAASLVKEAAKLGFIVEAGDARLRVAACPGAPACLNAVHGVRDDAARWARLLPQGEGVILHASGCIKGCARPVPTAVTLVAAEGGYDLVIDGRPGEEPARSGLAPREVDAFLAAEGAKLFARMGPMA